MPRGPTAITDPRREFVTASEQLEVLRAHHKTLQGVDRRLAAIKDELRRTNRHLETIDGKPEMLIGTSRWGFHVHERPDWVRHTTNQARRTRRTVQAAWKDASTGSTPTSAQQGGDLP